MPAVLAGAVCLSLLLSGVTQAHHSAAAYDRSVTKTQAGTLKEFDWNAPHAGMTVAYIDSAGHAQEISVTTAAPAIIARQGFKPSDFKPGLKVVLSWHPNRNGYPGGDMVELRLEDGRVLRGGIMPGQEASSAAGSK